MTEQLEERRRPSITSLVAFFLFILPMLYVLSIGPVVALVDAGYISRGGQLLEFLRVVYQPLQWCHDNVEWATPLFEWYFELWGAEPVTNEYEYSSIKY